MLTASLLKGGRALHAMWHRRRAPRRTTLGARYSFDDAAVRFDILAKGVDTAEVDAMISEQALRDAFGARGGVRSLLVAFDQGFSLINARALACLRDNPGQTVFLCSADFPVGKDLVFATTQRAALELGIQRGRIASR